MPTNIEVLKSIKKYTENLQEGELPEWIAPLFMDQPSPEYDTPEESAFDTALQELDNQNLDPNNPSAALSATLGAAKTHNVNPNQVVDRAQFRGTLRDIAKNVSLAIAVGIKADPERDKREQNTRTALSTLTPEVIGLAQAAKPEPNFPSLSDDAAAEAAAAAAAQQAATTGMGKAFGQMEGSQESQGTASAGTGSGRGGTGSSGCLSGGYDGPDSGADSSDAPSGADAAADAASGIRDGGRIGALIQHLQTGGDVENADTNMEVANVPMGVVDDPDGAPGPFSGGTGVEDDLDMDVEAGSYVLNAESVQLIGISDINEVIRDAYAIAAALGKPMPQDYDPQNKVPIRISNGEAVIPKSLVDIIGLDKLEKWNQKGLQLRKQKEEFMAQQQQAQPPQGPQVAAEAPMQQQMGQLMDKGGKVEKEDNRDLATRIADFLGLGDIWRAGEITEKTLKQRVLDVFDPKNTPGFQDGGPPIPKRRPMSFWEKVAKEVKETPENLVKWFSGDNESEVPPRPIPNPNRVPPRPNFYNELYNQIRKHENSKPTVYEDEVKDKTGKVIKIVPTVGIGYNLNNPTALQDFKNIGADYNAVKKGEKALDENQIRKLYDISVQRAEDDVRKLVPIFNDLPDNIQKVLIDMSFNLGQTKLKDFTDMLEAVNNKDYKNMKNEMIKSNWYDQVGDRSKNLVKMVQKEFMPLPIPRPENLNKEAN